MGDVSDARQPPTRTRWRWPTRFKVALEVWPDEDVTGLAECLVIFANRVSAVGERWLSVPPLDTAPVERLAIAKALALVEAARRQLEEV